MNKISKKRFSVGDIVTAGPRYSPAAFVITDVDLTKPVKIYIAMNIATGKRFRLGDGELTPDKVGTAAPAYLDKLQDGAVTGMTEDNREFLAGQQLANMFAAAPWMKPEEREKWAVLAAAKPGDALNVRERAGFVSVTFSHVLSKGQKFHFVATRSNGKSFKFTLESLVLIKQATTKA